MCINDIGIDSLFINCNNKPNDSFKEIKNNIPRLVVIERSNIQHNVDNILVRLKKLGVKNIIVRTKCKEKNIYKNIDEFLNYIQINKDEIIIPFIGKDNQEYIKDTKIYYSIDVFDRQYLLKLNFLMWCCLL
jgi:hypothetical protein